MAVVLITGCSSGFGMEAATRFAARGDTVWATMRRPEDSRLGDDVTVHALDVTDDGSVDACVGAVLARDGRIDVLVNNAGVGFIGSVETQPWELARSTMETNYWGAVRMMRAVLPAMRLQGGGRIVNVTSVAGLVPAAFNGYYSASKAALEYLTESMVEEVAPFGVRLALVEPGFFATAIVDKSKAVQPDVEESVYAATERTVIDFYEKGVAGGGDPGSVADTIVRVATVDAPPLRSVCGPDAEMLVEGYHTMSPAEFAAVGKALMGI